MSEEEVLRMDKARVLNNIKIIEYQLKNLKENIETKRNWYLNRGYDEEKLDATLHDIIIKLGGI